MPGKKNDAGETLREALKPPQPAHAAKTTSDNADTILLTFQFNFTIWYTI